MIQLTTLIVSFVAALVLQNPAQLNAAALPYNALTTAAEIASTTANIGANLALDPVNQLPAQSAPQTTEEKVEAYFSDVPILADVAECESNFRQTDANGELLHGVADPSDVGVMQIDEFYNGETAKKLGYDITTLDGNMEFARHLYNQYGTQPWASSEKCWSKLADAQDLAVN